MKTKYFFTPFLVICFLCSMRTKAQNPVEAAKQIEAHQIAPSQNLILDGRLDDATWNKIKPTSDFLVQVPIEGDEPSEKSEIRVAYDQNNLYIAVQFFDSEPDQIKAYQKKRDSRLVTDDRFQWILDTYLDGRNAYYFAINPNGVMQDGLIVTGQGSRLSLDWDGIWRVWTHIQVEGWSAEIIIPFKTLNFDPNSDKWGINFKRTIRRKNEDVVWSGYKRSEGLFRLQNAGVLTGLHGISQGMGLEGVPYLAARRLKIRDDDGLKTNYEGDFGFDLNYNITPGLKASFTYNTDFAETEVDTRRINLTRFPLFFPEKRDFFLEGSSIYSFAPSSGVFPYFSRRIGLNEGRAIPITAGARILGRLSGYDLAVQHVRTKSEGDLFAEDFSVARIKKNIGKESRIGFVYTRRSTDYNGAADVTDPLNDRHTLGADLELNTSEFLGDKNFQFQAYAIYHNADSPLNSSEFWDRTSRGIRLNFPNQPWSGHASYREFGTAYDPAVGFVSRSGFRRFQPSLSFNPLFEKNALIQDFEFDLRFEHLMSMDWELLTQEIRLDLFDITFQSGDRFALIVNREFERLTGEFDILRDASIVIPADDYITYGWRSFVSTASHRPVSSIVFVQSGGFWSGNRTQISTSITYKPFAGISFSGSYVYTKVSLLEGDFSTDLMRFSASFDLSPFLSFSTFIQWDNLSDQLGINNRFRWIIAPGNDVFIVYNHNWEDYMDRFRTLNSTATTKVAYTYRF